MTMVVAWAVFPLVLGLLCLGCGLLLGRIAKTAIPGPLLPAAGLAVIVVVAQLATLADATAELATPLVVALAAAGLGLALARGFRRPSGWPPAIAAAVFAVYAAPIVLSGEATFAGYIRLDDTATWMALTDRVMEHGRSLDGLAPSTYEATLAFNLGDGYPVGAFLPLGVGRQLVGTDVAWLVQPYMAFLAALLALALWDLGSRAIRPRPLAAAAAFLAAQPALLYGYYLWGGIKELAAAALLATVAALAGACVRRRFAPGAIVPLAVAGAAVVGVLSAGGALWLAPVLAAAAAFAVRLLGRPETVRRSLGFAALAMALSMPVLATGGLSPPTSSSLTSETAQGNLLEPLAVSRLAGIWPSGDFRLDPVEPLATHLLGAAVALAALIGLAWAWRARQWPAALYVAATLLAGLVIFLVGSPWVAAKALATASPAIPFAAVLGSAALWGGGRRAPAVAALALLAGGVLWSNALAYRDVNLAPRGQLAELERIGERIAGEGPVLMTEYQPYGVRHFLRDADPEGASELRRRQVALVGGGTLAKGATADTDRIRLDSLLEYRSLVLRRSPVQSRPPLPFELGWRGEHYEVWQRPPGTAATPRAHLGLGSELDPAAVPRCRSVVRLARRAGPGGNLVAVPRREPASLPAAAGEHPSGWDSPGGGRTIVPRGGGELTASLEVARAGRYEIWLRGSVRPRAEALVDGRTVGTVRHSLQNAGQYVRFGNAALAAGRHTVVVRFGDADLHPGSGGAPAPIGPLALSAEDAAETGVRRFPAAAARDLCGRRWDWIEAFG